MRASRTVLVVYVLCFVGFAFLYVPRLANPLWSDVEFTGWVSPIAQRMVEGQRIYRDFTLPIPPGSFALMAAFQSLTGRFFLLDELWLCALCQLLMVPIGYALVRPFTTERNATLATMAMVPVLIAAPKEIAYDHTALVVAWGSLLLLARGLLRAPGKVRWGLLASAGFAAGLTLVLKSSTGAGAITAVSVAMGGIAWVGRKTEGKACYRDVARDAAFVGGGLLAGVAATVLVVAVLGGSLGEFFHVVFVDGPRLKGGRGQALLNLLSYTIVQTPMHLSFLLALVLAYVLVRVVNGKDPLLVEAETEPDLAGEQGRAWWVFAVPMALYVLVVFAVASFLLAGNASHVPFGLQVGAAFGSAGPMMGMFVLLLLIVANWARAESRTDPRAVFAMVGLAAGVLSLMHNLSDPKHRPLYDNNPIIPLGIVSLLILLDQARARVLKYAVVCLMLLGLFGGKFQRYLIARTPVQDPGFWRGLRVNHNGTVLLEAALRARELAGPDGTVLSLPEDPMYQALIGRPRPNLRGGIVFVDQFPEHVLAQDLATLRANPPTVLLLHPEADQGWNMVYSIWSVDSPAARLQNGFLREHRDSTYRVDSTYPTWLFDNGVRMALLVRKGGTPSP